MKNIRSLFAFDRKQQRGIFVLVILLLIAGCAYLYVKQLPQDSIVLGDTTRYQSKIDSIAAVQQRRRVTIYPFNPNYITDYRGYKLGLGLEEIDRLHRFRESGKFINSKKEFQQVTQVSDRWLDSISPYFKFPEWVTNPKRSYTTSFWFLPFRSSGAVIIRCAKCTASGRRYREELSRNENGLTAIYTLPR